MGAESAELGLFARVTRLWGATSRPETSFEQHVSWVEKLARNSRCLLWALEIYDAMGENLTVAQYFEQ